MLNTKTIDLIIKTYNENNSIYQAAKIGKVTYQTAKRILINNNIIINNINNNIPEIIEIDPEISTELAPQQDINNIYNNNKYNNKEDINNNLINKEEDNNNLIKDDSQLDNKKEYYNSKIDTVLDKILKLYTKNIDDIPKSKLGIDFGIFYDKRFPKSADNTRINDNRSIIFANFGNNEDMINAINQIKTNKNKLVNR